MMHGYTHGFTVELPLNYKLGEGDFEILAMAFASHVGVNIMESIKINDDPYSFHFKMEDFMSVNVSQNLSLRLRISGDMDMSHTEAMKIVDHVLKTDLIEVYGGLKGESNG